MFKEIFLKHTKETLGNSTELSRFLDILKQLVRTPSVVGCEHPFFLVLQRELDEMGIKITLHEGVLVAEGHDPKRGMLSAHIDRHGLVYTGLNAFQYAVFTAHNRGDLTDDFVAKKTYKDIISPLTSKIAALCDTRDVTHGYKDLLMKNMNNTRETTDKAPYSLGSTKMGRLVNASQGNIHTGSNVSVACNRLSHHQ